LPVVVGDAGRVSRWVVPFSRQIRSNNTTAGRGLMNRPVKHGAVIRQHLLRHPIDTHGVQERLTDRPRGGAQDCPGDDAVPGMITDPGDDLHFRAGNQERAGRHVQLPQLHLHRAFPPLVVLPASPP
jgi:hypothetical protein